MGRGKKVDVLMNLWQEAIDKTRDLNVAQLSENDKVRLAGILSSTRTWIEHYLDEKLSDVTDPKKLTEILKRSSPMLRKLTI